MKASEAKPLSAEELNSLRDLLRRWVLRRYPWHSGSSECSDAYQVYGMVAGDILRPDSSRLDDLAERLGEMKEDGMREVEL